MGQLNLPHKKNGKKMPRQRKAGKAILPSHKVEEAKSLYISNQFTNPEIAKQLDISLSSVEKYAREGRWNDEKAAALAQISKVSKSVTGQLQEEEANVRMKQFQLTEIMLASLYGKFLNFDKASGVTTRVEGLDLKDIKVGIDILEKVQRIQFVSLGIREDDAVSKSELRKITNAFATVINEVVTDPEARELIQKKLHLLETGDES